MCRIDAEFGNHDLDEKSNPYERFIQALDENTTDGQFRSLVTKHFSENFKNFNDISDFEEVLVATKQATSEQEKCIAFLLASKTRLSEALFYSYAPNQQLTTNKHQHTLNFARDVAKTFFADSPYSFFANISKALFANHDYRRFLDCFYGEHFYLSQSFFDDVSIPNQVRSGYLWQVFYALAPQLQNITSSQEETGLLKDLISIAYADIIVGPPTKDAHSIKQAFEFISAWIKYDAQAGRLPDYFATFLSDDVRSLLESIQSFIEAQEIATEIKPSLDSWLKSIELDLKRSYFINTDLTALPEDKHKLWAYNLEHYYISDIKSAIYNDYGYDYNSNNRDEIALLVNKAFNSFCSQLSAEQINVWIHWCIDNDFKSILKNEHPLSSLSNSEKWCQEKFFEKWKVIFLNQLDDLSHDKRLRVLSSPAPIEHSNGETFYPQVSEWWHTLFNQQIENVNFPKDLIPDWTCTALYRLPELAEPYIDKSIGILRGKIQNTESCEQKIKEYDQQLETLLSTLDRKEPTKSLRHRLFLMRSSSKPFSDESLSKFSSFESMHCKWYYSFIDLVKTQFGYKTQGKLGMSSEDYSQTEYDFYLEFSYSLAEFCLSRIRLRKGEKAKDNKYESGQVVEQSQIWRQGYLKALTELGFDLSGSVHKTVNFTKKADPEQDVRDIASECYKAVRRNAKKNPTLQDLKRGIISAEWWFLLCQRQELNLEINPQEALKTRRKLLRNP